MSKGVKTEYANARKIAMKYVTRIACMPTTEKVAIVGSLRRKEEIVNDIDIQVIGSPSDIRDMMWMAGIEATSEGDRRCIYRLKSGVYLNIFFTQQHAWGSALMHNTGSKTYNIRRRLRSQAKGYKLNQYGIWDEEEKRVGDGIWDNEKKIYDFFGWPYVEPEDRE
tara:strand:+ start:253 stop:750 length:498 start_codon:yes stop_codon:yes gene_type:complete